MRVKSGLVGISLITVLALSGCGGKQEAAKAEVPHQDQDPNVCYEGNVKAPNWVCDPSMEGGMAAVGSASNGLDRDMQRIEAMGKARDELARQMGLKVKNMLKNFSQATGFGENQTMEKVTTSVSKQVAEQTLVGSVQKGSWKSPDGTLFIRMVIDQNKMVEIAQQTKESFKTSLRNDEALYQQFQAKKAMAELDAEIDKELSGN
jgi:hypothetical protein